MIVFRHMCSAVEQPEEQRRQQGGAERTVTILELGEDESGHPISSATLFSTIMIANAGRNAVKAATSSGREHAAARGHTGS